MHTIIHQESIINLKENNWSHFDLATFNFLIGTQMEAVVNGLDFQYKDNLITCTFHVAPNTRAKFAKQFDF